MTESVKSESRPLGGTNSRLPRGGWLLGPLLGLVFLIYPVRAVLTSEPTPARVALALGGAALFSGVFLWPMWTQEPLWSPSSKPSEIRKHRATVAFLAVLAISLNLVLGTEWRALLPRERRRRDYAVDERRLRGDSRPRGRDVRTRRRLGHGVARAADSSHRVVGDCLRPAGCRRRGAAICEGRARQVGRQRREAAVC